MPSTPVRLPDILPPHLHNLTTVDYLVTQWWYKPNIPSHHPLTRRAHTMVLYCDTIYLLGGENGHRELNDVWALDASVGMEKLTWDEVQTYDGTKSGARGHHAAKLVGKVMIVFEGAVEGSVSRMFGSWILVRNESNVLSRG